MKVLLVNKFHYRKGGAETYYFTLADALKKMGHEVIFFAMKDEKNISCDQEEFFVENSDYNGKTNIIKKIRMYNNIVYSKEAYNKMKKILKKYEPDVVILNNIHRQITTSIIDAIVEENIKIIWVVHDLIMLCPNYTMLDNNGNICEECLGNNFKNCLVKKCIKNSFLKSRLGYKEAMYNLKKNTYSHIDFFITPSDFYREKLIENGFDCNKVFSLKNPLPLDTKYEINEASDYILYFGRLSKEKGILTLFKAMTDIDYKLIVLGTGPMEEELKKFVSDKQLSERIQMLGFKSGSELEEIVSKAKCVVLPSEWYENGPYSAMEALAKGRPLIVSNVGGLPELVIDEQNGYIFEMGNSNDLKEKIIKLISLNDKMYLGMCNTSLELAKQYFLIDIYTNELFKIIIDM